MTWIAMLAAGDVPRRAKGYRRSDPDLTRGSIQIAFCLGDKNAPPSILRMPWAGGWCHIHILQDAQIALDLAGQRCVMPFENHGPVAEVRLSLSWDCATGWAELALDHHHASHPRRVRVAPLRPLPLRDIDWVLKGRHPALSRDVLSVAVASEIVPLGPYPGLARGTPILTPDGERAIETLRRGDRVMTDHGASEPILHTIAADLPALGRSAPVRLQAPYFNLKRDIVVAADQHVILRGTDVEYTFGKELIMLRAGDLVGSARAEPDVSGPVVTYFQLVLAGQESLFAAGTRVASLHVGRLRRNPEHLARSTLAYVSRKDLPEHGASPGLILRSSDTKAFMALRAA